MSDEIKEILDRLERIDHKEYIAFEFADSATFDEMAKCFEERKKLADYITNLQQENDRLNNIINELEKVLEFEKNDYGRDLDIETHNIDSEFIRGNSWEANYILDKLKELKENK